MVARSTNGSTVEVGMVEENNISVRIECWGLFRCFWKCCRSGGNPICETCHQDNQHGSCRRHPRSSTEQAQNKPTTRKHKCMGTHRHSCCLVSPCTPISKYMKISAGVFVDQAVVENSTRTTFEWSKHSVSEEPHGKIGPSGNSP